MTISKTSITKFLLLIIAFTLALSASYIFAVWTGPTQAPPGGNTPTPIHVGTTAQVKDGGLSLTGLSVLGGGYFQGNVGINVPIVGNVPQIKATLDVNGSIKIDDDNNASPSAGTIRWSGNDFEGYDGSAWVSLTGDGGGGGSGLCPPGQDYVAFGGTSICLSDGATASISCTGTYYVEAVDSTPGYNITVYVLSEARYISIDEQIQTKLFVSNGGSGSIACDSGWQDGLTASITFCNTNSIGSTFQTIFNGSSQTSSNGVSGNGSGGGPFCSTPIGAWQ